MDKVLWADLIIFQFPIWWSNFPAILKGWIDRVFYNGFAFNLARMQIYEQGLLKGKKAMLSFTTGATKDLYSEGGPHGDFEQILNYFQHVLIEFVGMEALPYFGIFGPMSMDEEELENQIALFQSIMESL
jgi:NAD(P)H dehydrogenase (quinone)